MSFKNMKAQGRAKMRDLPGVKLEDLYVKPGFNVRDHDEEYEAWLDAGVEFLRNKGRFPPLETWFNDDGKLEVIDGHGRVEIFKRAAAQGIKVEWIDVRPFEGNDVKRMARVATSNSSKPLKPMEYAKVCAGLRALGLDNTEIAKELNTSRTTVDKALTLADANRDVQTLVAAGKVSATQAVKTVKQHKGKAGAALKEAIQKAETQGKGKATNQHMGGVAKAVRKPSNAAILQLLRDVDGLLEKKLAETDATLTLEMATLRKGTTAMIKAIES